MVLLNAPEKSAASWIPCLCPASQPAELISSRAVLVELVRDHPSERASGSHARIAKLKRCRPAQRFFLTSGSTASALSRFPPSASPGSPSSLSTHAGALRVSPGTSAVAAGSRRGVILASTSRCDLLQLLHLLQWPERGVLLQRLQFRRLLLQEGDDLLFLLFRQPQLNRELVDHCRQAD